QHGQIHAALKRAESAEEVASRLSTDDGEAQAVLVDTASEQRANALAEELAALRAQHATIERDLEEARRAAEVMTASASMSDGAAASAVRAAELQVSELRAELDRLRAAPPVATVDPQDVAELRQAIRELGERFVERAADTASGEEDGTSLADRIRAFKAEREAQARRPLRIAARNSGDNG
ncbi:MAG: hypothetical protein AAGF49_12265, partial [Pseudomonadota bacterium]